jgi:hypothetical protein
MISTISANEVHQWSLQWLMHAELLKRRSTQAVRVCTATVIWSVMLRAAARLTSVYAACLDLAEAPSQQAVFDALEAGLPRTLTVLERRLNETLTHAMPRRLRRPSWNVAIDLHLTPYYGEPLLSRNELVRSKPKQGTTRFHAYATACIVQHGERYTLALTWVRRHEAMVTVLERLLARIADLGLKIKRLLMDRAFFNVPVTAFLQAQNLPFVMPVMFRGRRPKKGRKSRGLRAIRQQGAGRYPHVLKNRARQVELTVVVAYRTQKNRKTGRRVREKLLFGVWRVRGTPQQIRELYRTRFGIETSYRQLREARIRTCTPNPRLRLVFIAIALLLRNLWVWIHAEVLYQRRARQRVVRLERLRFKRLLDWIVQAIVAQLHDGSMPTAAYRN